MDTKGNKDGGYAWIILAACVVLQFLTDGIMKSFGLFYVEILQEYKESVSVTTLITGIMNGVFCLSTLPIMMYFIKAITPRKAVMFGCLLTSAGYSLSCLAESIHFMFFTLSFLVGGGMAMIYSPSIFVLGTYFEKRRAMANGIAISGCCLGGLLCPPLYRYLLDTYGLRGAMLLTGGILLHNLPMACLLRSNEIVSGENEMKTKYSSDESHNDKTSDVALMGELDRGTERVRVFNKHPTHVSQNEKQLHSSDPVLFKGCNLDDSRLIFSSENHLYKKLSEQANKHLLALPSSLNHGNSNMSIALSMKELNDQNKNDDIHVEQPRSKCPAACTPLLNLTFVLFIFANALASIIAVTFLSFLPLYASENNIDNKKIVILVSLTGAVDFISRIISGMLADRPEIKTYHIIAVSQAVCGIAYNCNQLMTTFTGLIVFCVIIGLFGGVQLVLMYTHIVEIVGLTLSPSALAITIVCQLPTFIFGPLVFGLLRDITGNFKASYHVIGTIALFSAVLFMCESFTKRCDKKSSPMKKENLMT